MKAREFADPLLLAARLADDVATHLRAALALRDGAILAVSGGRTPARLFRALAGKPLDWRRVTVTLCDERCVPPSHERSNERLVRGTLLQDAAAAATFVGLYDETRDPDDAAQVASSRIGALPAPFDVVLLGMGEDGHTASWLPDGDRLDQALGNTPTPGAVIALRARSVPEPRLTLTLPAIRAARAIFLQVEGVAKKPTLERALAEGVEPRTLPVAAIIQRSESPVAIYWSP